MNCKLEIEKILRALQSESNKLLCITEVDYDDRRLRIRFKPHYMLDIRAPDDFEKPAQTCLSVKGLTAVIPVDFKPKIKTITQQFMLATYAFSIEMQREYPQDFIALDQMFHESLMESTRSPSFRIPLEL